MKQKIANLLLSLIFIGLGVVILGILILDGVAQSIIQKGGSESLGTKVKTDSVHVGFFGKNSGVKGLYISNPDFFNSEASPWLLTMEEASIEFGMLQLIDAYAKEFLEGLPVEIDIPLITARGIVLDLQQVDEQTNIEWMIQNISSKENSEHVDLSEGLSFNIREMILEDITVLVSGSLGGVTDETVSAKIDKLLLRDISSRGDAQLATEAITAAATHAITDHLLQHPAEGFSKVVLSRITDAVHSLPILHELGIAPAIQELTDSIGQEIDEVLNVFDSDTED